MGQRVLAYLETSERYARVYEQDGVAGWLTTAGSEAGDGEPAGGAAGGVAGAFHEPRGCWGSAGRSWRMSGGADGGATGSHDDLPDGDGGGAGGAGGDCGSGDGRGAGGDAVRYAGCC